MFKKIKNNIELILPKRVFFFLLIIYQSIKYKSLKNLFYNEDLDRETDEKTSAVHFMRFEFVKAMIADFCKGINVKIGVSHPNYDYEIILDKRVQDELNQDFMNGEV